MYESVTEPQPSFFSYAFFSPVIPNVLTCP